MTPEEIDKLEAGPELDALVALKVFGREYPWTLVGGAQNRPIGCPAYSTDQAAAFEVAKKVGICFGPMFGTWKAEATSMENFGANPTEATTGQLAICRAALKAVEGESPKCR